ncbi:MAG: aminotransferase class I/II-fold pyridoxal phosphate-dependent enzyme, partial [Candidatus Micrarchaeota archaeon]|nr:aminotransferase class I/II-fold pyridoxal phosphate-dependent enzyme [Candidatus Micrarchaeota archaeon]
AGARAGYAVASLMLAAELNKLRLPNSVSGTSAYLAEAALGAEGIHQMRQGVAVIASEREKLANALVQTFRVFPSQTNFLLVEALGQSGQALFESLLSAGMVVRNFSQNKLTPNCLRITVRGPAENRKLLEALA